MTDDYYQSLKHRLSEDLACAFGERIPLKEAAKLLWYSTESAFEKALQLGFFPLPVHGKGRNAEKYVLRRDLEIFLLNQYVKAVSLREAKQNEEKMMMK
ncbi:MAG: hypothetical protein K6L80_09765 [Agarilytica sp.]